MFPIDLASKELFRWATYEELVVNNLRLLVLVRCCTGAHVKVPKEPEEDTIALARIRAPESLMTRQRNLSFAFKQLASFTNLR